MITMNQTGKKRAKRTEEKIVGEWSVSVADIVSALVATTAVASWATGLHPLVASYLEAVPFLLSVRGPPSTPSKVSRPGLCGEHITGGIHLPYLMYLRM